MKKISVLAILCFLLISCEKDKDSIDKYSLNFYENNRENFKVINSGYNEDESEVCFLGIEKNYAIYLVYDTQTREKKTEWNLFAVTDIIEKDFGYGKKEKYIFESLQIEAKENKGDSCFILLSRWYNNIENDNSYNDNVLCHMIDNKNRISEESNEHIFNKIYEQGSIINGTKLIYNWYDHAIVLRGLPYSYYINYIDEEVIALQYNFTETFNWHPIDIKQFILSPNKINETFLLMDLNWNLIWTSKAVLTDVPVSDKEIQITSKIINENEKSITYQLKLIYYNGDEIVREYELDKNTGQILIDGKFTDTEGSTVELHDLFENKTYL